MIQKKHQKIIINNKKYENFDNDIRKKPCTHIGPDDDRHNVITGTDGV